MCPVKLNGDVRWVTCAFALMSRKTINDYEFVFKKILGNDMRLSSIFVFHEAAPFFRFKNFDKFAVFYRENGDHVP